MSSMHKTNVLLNASYAPVAAPPDGEALRRPTLSLVSKLCRALAEAQVDYCHWKSNNALDRSMSGDNDLDLLVSRNHMSRFVEILASLEFKQAKAPPEKQMEGVSDYFGYDTETRRLVHVHAHYQLVLGHDLTKNFRLPIEQPYIASSVQGDVFRVPAPEFEFIIFVIRMVLKHLTWDMVLTGTGELRRSEQEELDYLQGKIRHEHLSNVLGQCLPYVGWDLFNACVRALQPGGSPWARIKTGHLLLDKLQANARHASSMDAFMRLWQRGIQAVRYRIGKSSGKYTLVSGGAMIAIVGADGAGKSTVIEAVYTLLSRSFRTTKVHMGKPAWSWSTMVIRGVLKAGQVLGLYPLESPFRETLEQTSLVSPGYPWLVREICRARDRYRTYVKARRYAAKGGLVILDRFPLRQIQLMDGPQTARFVKELSGKPQSRQFMSPVLDSRLTSFMIRQEEEFYRRIAAPEVLIVLRVDPRTAVLRKAGDDPIIVGERAAEISTIDWTALSAHVIDAAQSKGEVASQIETLIWSEI